MFGLILSALAVSAEAAGRARAQMPEAHRGFFKRYCLDCHGPEEQKGQVRLDTLSLDIGADVQTADTWQKILGALNSGEMPPETEQQPTSDEKADFLEELSEKMVVARRILADSGGAAVMRRLNRREYRNTLRDLLGVTTDVSRLPSDRGAGNFDTVGNSLFFSPAQFELYLKLGRRALDEAIVTTERPSSTIQRTEVEERARREAEGFYAHLRDGLERYRAWLAADGKRSPADFGFLDEPRARRAKKLYDKNAPYYKAWKTWPLIDKGAYFNQIHSTFAAGFTQEHPPGEYLVRLRVGAVNDAPANRRFVEFGRVVDVGGRTDFSLVSAHQVTGTIARPRVIEIPVTLDKSSGRDFTFREMRPDHKMGNWKKNPVVPPPVLWVDWVEIEGPLVAQWPPESHRRIFFGGEDREKNEAYAREAIARFARRAFRGREVEPEFLDRLVAIYRQLRKTGATFEVSVKEALAVVLASPEFLYLSEGGVGASERGDAQSGDLSNVELASRLSYFLWSAPPDEALLAAARDGSLRSVEGLRSQVNRMLDDPRSRQFVTGFTHQWLDLDRIDLFQFDEELYPDFDEATKAAAVEEVYRFFDTVLRENLSSRCFLENDFVVVNGLMAQYYGIDGVTGDAWRKAPAPRHRGGLLGMAATLAMGSDGQRTSPVERGAFVLRKLLHDPPPPAPANVPQLSRLDEQPLSTRERLAVHQQQPQCSHCHRKIDPIGFGLENFNAAGRWRTEEMVYEIAYNKNGNPKRKEVGPQPIDAGGRLHEGPKFADYYELRRVIASRADDFNRGLIEALLEYALGRRLSFSDEALIDELQDGMRRDDYRLRTLIHLIVRTPAFRSKSPGVSLAGDRQPPSRSRDDE